MKINRQINECHCYNCRKYEECQTKGVFDDDPGFDFCVNYDYCRITERWPECSEECTFAKLWMTTKQSERVLYYLQKWRRGGRGRQPHPYVIGKAIDSALHILRRSRKRIINV